jgi:hypothetical protein
MDTNQLYNEAIKKKVDGDFQGAGEILAQIRVYLEEKDDLSPQEQVLNDLMPGQLADVIANGYVPTGGTTPKVPPTEEASVPKAGGKKEAFFENMEKGLVDADADPGLPVGTEEPKAEEASPEEETPKKEKPKGKAKKKAKKEVAEEESIPTPEISDSDVEMIETKKLTIRGSQFVGLDQYHTQKASDKPTEEFAKLVESIKEKGILVPLLTTPSNEHKGFFEVIDGHHRLLAAKQAEIPKVPCVVREVSSDEEKETLALLCQLLRRHTTNSNNRKLMIARLVELAGKKMVGPGQEENLGDDKPPESQVVPGSGQTETKLRGVQTKVAGDLGVDRRQVSKAVRFSEDQIKILEDSGKFSVEQIDELKQNPEALLQAVKDVEVKKEKGGTPPKPDTANISLRAINNLNFALVNIQKETGVLVKAVGRKRAVELMVGNGLPADIISVISGDPDLQELAFAPQVKEKQKSQEKETSKEETPQEEAPKHDPDFQQMLDAKEPQQTHPDPLSELEQLGVDVTAPRPGDSSYVPGPDFPSSEDTCFGEYDEDSCPDECEVTEECQDETLSRQRGNVPRTLEDVKKMLGTAPSVDEQLEAAKARLNGDTAPPQEDEATRKSQMKQALLGD